MSRVIVNDAYLTEIANAIRDKLNTEDTYTPAEMAEAIESISGGGSTPIINALSVTENGTYTAPTGVDGYSPITVNVPQGSTPTGTKQISITENGTTTEDVTNYANAEITVNVSGGGGTPGAEFLWANTAEVVTIGANSVANTQAAYQYFSSYTFKYLLLLSPLTENNQYVSWANGSVARYRNGAIATTSTGTNYDAKLVEGSQYLLLSD